MINLTSHPASRQSDDENDTWYRIASSATPVGEIGCTDHRDHEGINIRLEII
jgi:hypothetical protein